MKRLANKTVLITRAGKQAGQLTALLEQEGALVIEVPAIEITPLPENLAELKAALQHIGDYHWLLLTSVNTVTMLIELLAEMNLQWNHFSGLKIGCIGTSTANAVRENGGTVHLIPDRFQAEGLVEALGREEIRGRRILLPRAKGSREVLPKSLTKMGAIVHEIYVYRAGVPETSRELLRRTLEQKAPNFITFTSSSTAHHFVELAGELLQKLDLTKTRFASIGPVTTATLADYGLPVAVEAKEFTIRGLVEAMAQAASS